MVAGLLSRAVFGCPGDGAGSPVDAPLDRAAALAALDERTVGVAARFVSISPGTFIMGGGVVLGGNGTSEPPRLVTIARGYEMEATETTQLQYVLVTGANPSQFKKREDCGMADYRVIGGVELCAENPVENVSWNEVQGFIALLNAAQSRYVYRLPTEAEWEYAEKATDWIYRHSGWHSHPVASTGANAWGLYDMLGNVDEWTQDMGGAEESCRVVRGGPWNVFSASPPVRCVNANERSFVLGFRLVREKL